MSDLEEGTPFATDEMLGVRLRDLAAELLEIARILDPEGVTASRNPAGSSSYESMENRLFR